MDPFTILAALIPTLKYAFTRMIDYKTGGPKPTNAQEAVQLGDVEIRRLEAVAKIDNADGASTWVVNIRALQRPIVVFVVLVVWAFIALNNQIQVSLITDLASTVIFYLFGERTAMAIQKSSAK